MPVSDDDKSKFKDLYLQTAKAYIDDIQRNLLILRSDFSNKESIGVVHMAAHSLTSQSILMGFGHVAAYSRLIEMIFRQKINDNNRILDFELVQEIDKGLVELYKSLDAIKDNGVEVDMSPFIKLLESRVHN